VQLLGGTTETGFLGNGAEHLQPKILHSVILWCVHMMDRRGAEEGSTGSDFHPHIIQV
jgi:hypothetical protein